MRWKAGILPPRRLPRLSSAHVMQFFRRSLARIRGSVFMVGAPRILIDFQPRPLIHHAKSSTGTGIEIEIHATQCPNEVNIEEAVEVAEVCIS